MKARPAGRSLHWMAHVEAVKEYRSGGEGDLGQLEHYSDLEDEIHAFAAVFALFFGGKAIED